MRSSVLACGALRAGLRDLPFLRLAQALLECREVEGLLQHDKALLHRIARAVAIARRQQHRHPAVALANGMPELKPGHSAMSENTTSIFGSFPSSSRASWAFATCLTM